MVFKRLQDSQDGLYLQAMQLYQTSFPLHELRQPGAGAAWAKRKAGHSGDRPAHR